MKFGHRLFHSAVPEWKDQYIDYKLLKHIIGETAHDALTLAQAYDTVLRLTSVVVDENVHLLQLASQQKFFDTLEEQVAKAEAFYRQRLIEAVQNFYLLVQAAVEQGLVQEFVPYQVEGGSRLVRELARLDLRLNVKITAADDRDANDNNVDYRLLPFHIGMHFEDMPLPEFNDIVFVRRRPQHETTIKDIAALAFAASRGYVESMRTMLFETRIDPNSLDYDGRTALYVAVNNEQVEAIELLLEAGADPNIVDSDGRSAIDRAYEIGRDDIAELLEQHHAGHAPQLKETELRVVDMHEREAAAKTVKAAIATRKGFSERLDKELNDPEAEERRHAAVAAATKKAESQGDDQFTHDGHVRTDWSVAASRLQTPGQRRFAAPQHQDDPDAGVISRPISDPAAVSVRRPNSEPSMAGALATTATSTTTSSAHAVPPVNIAGGVTQPIAHVEAAAVSPRLTPRINVSQSMRTPATQPGLGASPVRLVQSVSARHVESTALRGAVASPRSLLQADVKNSPRLSRGPMDTNGAAVNSSMPRATHRHAPGAFSDLLLTTGHEPRSHVGGPQTDYDDIEMAVIRSVKDSDVAAVNANGAGVAAVATATATANGAHARAASVTSPLTPRLSGRLTDAAPGSPRLTKPNDDAQVAKPQHSPRLARLLKSQSSAPGLQGRTSLKMAHGAHAPVAGFGGLSALTTAADHAPPSPPEANSSIEEIEMAVVRHVKESEEVIGTVPKNGSNGKAHHIRSASSDDETTMEGPRGRKGAVGHKGHFPSAHYEIDEEGSGSSGFDMESLLSYNDAMRAKSPPARLRTPVRVQRGSISMEMGDDDENDKDDSSETPDSSPTRRSPLNRSDATSPPPFSAKRLQLTERRISTSHQKPKKKKAELPPRADTTSPKPIQRETSSSSLLGTATPPYRRAPSSNSLLGTATPPQRRRSSNHDDDADGDLLTTVRRFPAVRTAVGLKGKHNQPVKAEVLIEDNVVKVADSSPEADGGSLFQKLVKPIKPMVQPVGRAAVGSSRVDLQACKLEYSIVSPK